MTQFNNNRGYGDKYGPTPAEREVLDAIERETNLHFHQIGGIDLNDKAAVLAVLPIAFRLIAESTDPGVKSALKCLFSSRYARSYIGQLVEWMENEEDLVTAGILVNIVATHVNASHAPRAWRFLESRLGDVPNGYRLAVSLLRFESIQAKVRSRLLADLESGLSAGDVADVRRARDTEIQHKIAELYRPPSPLTLPASYAWRRDRTGPARVQEVTSAEIDLSEVPSTLQVWTREYQISPCESAKAPPGRVSVDCWYCANVKDIHCANLKLWIRFEDIDVVELVLTRGA